MKEKHCVIDEINSCCTVKRAKSIRDIIIVIVTICNSQIFIESLSAFIFSISFSLLNNQRVVLLALFLSPQVLRNYCPPQWCWEGPKRIRRHHLCPQRVGNRYKGETSPFILSFVDLFRKHLLTETESRHRFSHPQPICSYLNGSVWWIHINAESHNTEGVQENKEMQGGGRP